MSASSGLSPARTLDSADELALGQEAAFVYVASTDPEKRLSSDKREIKSGGERVNSVGFRYFRFMRLYKFSPADVKNRGVYGNKLSEKARK